jgi:hypothetical protein
MAQPSLSNEALIEALELVKSYSTVAAAAKATGLNPSTLHHRLRIAKNKGLSLPEEFDERASVRRLQEQLAESKAKVGTLEAAAAADMRDRLSENFVKSVIIELKNKADRVDPPKWLMTVPKTKTFAGVPTLLASDWHWGENVDPNQINQVNEYNMSIAKERARTLINKAIELLGLVQPANYPGIVFALGGDLVSGDIHEELSATNDREIMPVVLDLFGTLVWCINKLADHFGNVFVPCVSGNHGRNTHKIRSKGRNFTSFDWLVYQFLQKHFEDDTRVQFLIPDGPDAYFSVLGRRYLLTHGDQFRGGDGMIGALGPIIRGDHKKRSRNGQIDMEYDTMLLGHFHQLIQLERVIVNGSLVGMSEYGWANNFGYEVPRQALWITHPQHGITFSMPVRVDKHDKAANTNEWVSWAAGQTAK